MSSNQNLTTTQSSLIILSDSEAKVDEKRILLKVQCVGEEAGQYYYWISKRLWLAEVMLDYTRRLGISISSIRVLCNDSVLLPFRLHAAEDLDLKDGDSIDIIRKDEYKHRVAEGSESSLIALPRGERERPICLNMETKGRDGNLYYLIGRKTPLENVFRDYADRTFRFYDCTIFSDTRFGSDVDPRKTADDLKLDDGDTIRAEPNVMPDPLKTFLK